MLGKVRMFCCSLLAQPGSDYGAEEYLVQQDGLYVLVPVDLEYYDYKCYRYLLPAPYTGFACFSQQVLLYTYLPLQ